MAWKRGGKNLPGPMKLDRPLQHHARRGSVWGSFCRGAPGNFPARQLPGRENLRKKKIQHRDHREGTEYTENYHQAARNAGRAGCEK